MAIIAGATFIPMKAATLLLKITIQRCCCQTSEPECITIPTPFFTGLSIPYFLSYKEKANHDGFEVFHDVNNYNFLFTAGFLFNVSPNFRIKPSTLVKYNMTAKEQFDLNLNIITLNDMLSFGALYRTGEAMAGIVEVQLNHQLRIGCTYEYSTPSANTYNYYSYEFSVRYEFQYKIKAANPRLF